MTSASETGEVVIDWRSSLRNSLPRLILGGILGGAAFWLAFRGVDGRVMWSALRHMHYGWASLALLSILLTLVLVTFRWRLLFYPNYRERRMLNLFNGVVTGQMLNIVVPARLGDVARAYMVGTNEQVSKTRVLATIGVEKAVDLGTFALSVIFLLLSMSLPAWLRDSGDALLVTSGIVIGATLVFSFWGQSGLRWLEELAQRLPERFGQYLTRYGHLALEGLSALRHWWTHLLLWSLSLCVLILSASTNYLLFVAFGLRLPPLAAVFLLVVLQVGNAPPSLPGKLGVFHYLTVLALSAFAVDRSVALSYAFALYVVAILPKIILGTFILIWFRWLPALNVLSVRG